MKYCKCVAVNDTCTARVDDSWTNLYTIPSDDSSLTATTNVFDPNSACTASYTRYDTFTPCADDGTSGFQCCKAPSNGLEMLTVPQPTCPDECIEREVCIGDGSNYKGAITGNNNATTKPTLTYRNTSGVCTYDCSAPISGIRYCGDGLLGDAVFRTGGLHSIHIITLP